MQTPCSQPQTTKSRVPSEKRTAKETQRSGGSGGSGGLKPLLHEVTLKNSWTGSAKHAIQPKQKPSIAMERPLLALPPYYFVFLSFLSKRERSAGERLAAAQCRGLRAPGSLRRASPGLSRCKAGAFGKALILRPPLGAPLAPGPPPRLTLRVHLVSAVSHLAA